MSFEVSKSFPVITDAGQSIFPSVIARSYQSLKDKKVDIDHAIKAYYPASDNIRERVIGAVLDVQFPPTPQGGWKVGSDISNAPGIKGLAVIWKEADGVAELFGAHLAGSKTLTVSMELNWALEDSGWCVKLAGQKPGLGKDTTPPDVLAAGWEYIPHENAPAELRACYSEKARRVVRSWQGRKAIVMLGGLTGSVLYSGLGIVRFGAERTAKITQVLAFSKEADLDAAMAALATAFVNRLSNR